MHYTQSSFLRQKTLASKAAATKYKPRTRCKGLARLRIEPLPALALQQLIGFARPPTAGWILRNAGGFCRAPDIENGIDQRPGGLDRVAAIEQCSVSAYAIADQRCVSAVSAVAKTFAIAEIHIHVADAHLWAGTLGAEGNRNAFVRLNVENQPIRLNIAIAEHDVRRFFKLNHNFRAALLKPLSRPQVKRNVSPAPIVDLQLHGDERCGARFGIDSLLLAVARNGFRVDIPRSILAAHYRLRHHSEVEGPDGLQHLEFLIAQCGGVEGSRRLDGNQRSQLQNMALNHVAQRARGFVEAAAPLHSKSFRGGDLHMIDVVAIPQRLKDAVTEPQD